KRLLVNRSQASHHASQLHHASGITALPDHLVDARGTQPGITLQGLTDELYIGVGHQGTKRLDTIELLGIQRMADRVRVQSELLRDSANFPMFGIEPMTDLCLQVAAEHVHLRKIRGNGSTKRPRRPQRTQRSKPWCRSRAPFVLSCGFRIGSAPCSGILPL